MVYEIRVEGLEEAHRFVRRLSVKMNKSIEDANYELAKISANYIRTQLLLQQKQAPRNTMASRINARRLSRKRSVVFMPQKAIWLDSMRPHYVALRRGRQVTQWVNRYYGDFIKTGLSRVFRRYAKTGVKTRFGSPVYVKGFLYVTPDPFVSRALNKARRKYGAILKYAVRRAIKQSR